MSTHDPHNMYRGAKKLHCFLYPGTGAEYCNQFVCVSVREHISGTTKPIFTKFFVQSPVAVAQSSSGDIAVCYVLHVWSQWAVWPCVTSGVVIPGRSLMAVNAVFKVRNFRIR